MNASNVVGPIPKDDTIVPDEEGDKGNKYAHIRKENEEDLTEEEGAWREKDSMCKGGEIMKDLGGRELASGLIQMG